MNDVEKLINYIIGKYKKLERENIGGNSNITRYTNPTMSCYVENAIALFLNEVLKNKKFNYYIDSQLSIGNGHVIRPDIIIYDDDNVIHGIVEVKSQLGFSGRFNFNEYKKKIQSLKNASNKGMLSLKKKQIDFKMSEKCLDFIVILMSSNSHNNFDRFKNLNYFLLFNDADVWYGNLSLDSVNHGRRGVDDLINYVKKM